MYVLQAGEDGVAGLSLPLLWELGLLGGLCDHSPDTINVDQKLASWISIDFNSRLCLETWLDKHPIDESRYLQHASQTSFFHPPPLDPTIYHAQTNCSRTITPSAPSLQNNHQSESLLR